MLFRSVCNYAGKLGLLRSKEYMATINSQRHKRRNEDSVPLPADQPNPIPNGRLTTRLQQEANATAVTAPLGNSAEGMEAAMAWGREKAKLTGEFGLTEINAKRRENFLPEFSR